MPYNRVGKKTYSAYSTASPDRTSIETATVLVISRSHVEYLSIRVTGSDSLAPLLYNANFNEYAFTVKPPDNHNVESIAHRVWTQDERFASIPLKSLVRTEQLPMVIPQPVLTAVRTWGKDVGQTNTSEKFTRERVRVKFDRSRRIPSPLGNHISYSLC